MAKVVYVGPFDGVEIPALGLDGVVRGVPFEVDDEGAVEALLAQPSNFELAPAPAGRKGPAPAGGED